MTELGNARHRVPSGDEEQLRAAVRAVLADVLGEATSIAPTTAAQPVDLRDQADLDALLRQVALLCEDPGHRAAIAEGRHGFRLGRRASGGPARAGRPPVGGRRGGDRAVEPTLRVDRGAVTERMVARAAAEESRLVLGPRAVLTPLARDRARTLGVRIERER